MGFYRGPNIVRDELRIILDAASPRSYPGSGNTWYDLGPSGYNFTGTNVSHNSNGYFTYNGTNAYHIASGSPSNLSFDNNSSTVGVWFRPHTTSPSSDMAILSDNWGPEFGIWALTNGNIAGYAYGSRTFASTANQWVYTVMTATLAAGSSGGAYSLEVFKNGKSIGSTSGTVGNGANDFPISLGFDYKGGSPAAYFDGDIARVEIYQRILSDAEIAQNFNANRSRFGI